MEAGHGHELELVAHGADRALVVGDLVLGQLLAPVERGRAVIGQHLAGEPAVDRVGEARRLLQVRLAGLPPEQVGVGRVGQAAGDRVLDAEALADPEEALGGAFAAQERPVSLVDVGGEQLCGVAVGSAQQHRRHPLHVGRQPCGVQRADVLADRHQHLAAEMAALLLRRELVLEMHTGGTRLDHRPHQLERVQRAAEAGLGIGDDRRHPLLSGVALEAGDLVGAAQRVVDATHHHRHRVGRIQRLVRIHLAGEVGVRCHLPAGQVDRLEPGLDLLHRLVAGQRAERVHVGLGLEQVPQAVRTLLGQRVPDAERAGEARHLGLGEVAAYAGETVRIFRGDHD